MKITKRNGVKQDLSFDKVLHRISNLATDKTIGVLNNIESDIISQQVIKNIYDGITSSEMDDIASRIAISLTTENPEYGILASRIAISNMHKSTNESFVTSMEILYNNTTEDGISVPLLNDTTINIIRNNKDEFERCLDYSRDYLLDFFGFKTLERSYLLKIYDGMIKGVNKNRVIERPQHMWLRVSIGIHKDDIKKVIETYNLMSTFQFTHASPTLFNGGTCRQQMSSCFLLSIPTDSMQGIYKCISDCAMISKNAGGIGVHVSNIRSKGSYIKGTNGRSDGLVKMLKVFNETARYANQGSKRNGSIAIYIEPYHADIYEFLELRKNSGDETMRARDLFYALWINDVFMEAVETDSDWYLMSEDTCHGLSDVYGKEFKELYNLYIKEKKYRKIVKARDLWQKILVSQIETGMPYMSYKDTVNEKSNQKNVGTIKSSNLCVAPETKILTSKGYYEIKDIQNQEVEVWNGNKFSKTTVLKTGENQELLKVKLSNGSEIECTPYHKFYIIEGERSSDDPRIRKIEAKELTSGMELINCDFPIIREGDNSFPSPYENGLLSADGTNGEGGKCISGSTYCKDNLNRNISHIGNISNDYVCNGMQGLGHPVLYLYGEKKELINHLSFKSYKVDVNKNRINCVLNRNDIVKKFTVPINCNLDIKLRWLEGYLDGDGRILKSGNNIYIQAESIDKVFLTDIKYLLQTLGCDPTIVEHEEEEMSLLPNGINSSKFFCNKSYRILITGYEDTSLLVSLGFSPKILKLTDIYPRKNTKRCYVKNIEYNNRISDTYCFTEPVRNMGVFNGILAGNCNEITLYSDKDEIAVCNICTFSLPKYLEKGGVYNHEKLYNVVKIATKNMNNVIDNNYYPTPETKKSNLRHRPIAMGIQGLANLFFELRIPYESEEAVKLNKEIMETIQYAGWTASMELSKDSGITYETYLGSPISEGLFQHNLCGIEDKELSGRWDWDILRQNIKKYGVLNSMITALPPTASTSQILGNYESFEPQNSNMFMRSTLSGDFPIINKYLISDLIELKIWNKKMKERIINDNGSVQNIPEIPTKIKNIYKTIWEIPQKHLINMSVDRSIFVDQSQSLNIFMAKPTISKLSSMHFYTWKAGLKTGMYYLRTKSASQAQKFTVSNENVSETSIVKEQQLCSINNSSCESCSG